MLKFKIPKIRINQSLRTRLMSFIGILFLVLAGSIIVSILIFVNTTEKEAWRARQTEAAQNAARTVSDYLQQNENVLRWLDKYEYDEIEVKPQILQEVLKDNPAFMEILFVDEKGNPIYDRARDQVTLANQFTILQSEWFQTASSGQKLYTRVQTSSRNQSYIIFAMPSRHGGVLAAQIQMDALWDTVGQIRFGKTGSVFIVNQNGQVIAHSDREVVLSNQNISDTKQFKNILQAPEEKWIGDTVNFKGINVVTISTPIELTQWIVISELPQTEAFATSRRASVIIPSSIVLLMLIATIGFRVTLDRWIIRPLNLLHSGASQVGQGNLSYRIKIPRMDEMGELMKVFNSMTTDLEKQRHDLRKQTEEIAGSLQQIQIELSEREKAEAALKRLNEELEMRVKERTADIIQANENLKIEVQERTLAEEHVRASLQEKEVLLKEIHHRVKNNLQIISSLLNLQTDQVNDTGTLRALRDSQTRVRSMALIHEKLYQSKSLAKIEFGEYVQTLAKDLFRSYQRILGDIQLNIQVDEISLDLDYAVPCGLILNELMTNALKYAFPNGRKGTIQIELRANPENTINLRVADNGVGLPTELNVFAAKSLGLQLVNSLVAQVNGKLTVEALAGTAFLISFQY